jgi:hypothetical protein
VCVRYDFTLQHFSQFFDERLILISYFSCTGDKSNVNNQLYNLTWGDFSSCLATSVQQFRSQGNLVDVTLSAGGRSFPAHKIVLSAASPFLLDLLKVRTQLKFIIQKILSIKYIMVQNKFTFKICPTECVLQSPNTSYSGSKPQRHGGSAGVYLPRRSECGP